VTESGRLIVETRPRGVLRAELFDVQVTVDRDGDEEVWTREQWQDTKQVVLDEWSTQGLLPRARTAGRGGCGTRHRDVRQRDTRQRPTASRTIGSARLQLGRLGEGRGQHVGSVGHQG
jgi:hypothetical protein